MGSGRGPSPARGLSRCAFLFFSSFFFFQRKRKRKRNLTGKYGFGPGNLLPSSFPISPFLLLLFFFQKEKKSTTPKGTKNALFPIPPAAVGFLLPTFLFSKRKVGANPRKGNPQTLFSPSPGRRWFSFACFSFFQKKSRSEPPQREPLNALFPIPPAAVGFLLPAFLFSKRKVGANHRKGNPQTLFSPSPGRRWFSFAYFSFFQKKSRGSRHIRSGAFMPSRPRPTATTWRAASVRARRALRTAGSSAMMRRS